MTGLYLHIPFCHALCNYCNFNRGLFDGALAARYVPALEREIVTAGTGEAADTIFFGGGTPSILEPADIGRLIRACRVAFDVPSDAEVTLETNPETVTPDRMAQWRAVGINRVSLGAQTFDDAELRRLERIHDAGRIENAVRAARGAGFTNVSLDLMFWLPGQSRDSWRRTLERALALGPEHLSLYLLELYPNAPLREAMARANEASAGHEGAAGHWMQEPDDEAADMYLEAFERLELDGLLQYEISNAARPGLESRHNLKYWTGGDWYGFGCGAHSTVRGIRWQNVAGTSDYITRMEIGRPVALGHQSLDERARSEEALFTGLRLTRGIDCTSYSTRFGFDPWERYGSRLVGPLEAGLVWRRPGAFGLTRSGMLVSNEFGQLVV